MNLENEKLLWFLRDGHATMFICEMKDGFEWGWIAEIKPHSMMFSKS